MHVADSHALGVSNSSHLEQFLSCHGYILSAPDLREIQVSCRDPCANNEYSHFWPVILSSKFYKTIHRH